MTKDELLTLVRGSESGYAALFAGCCCIVLFVVFVRSRYRRTWLKINRTIPALFAGSFAPTSAPLAALLLGGTTPVINKPLRFLLRAGPASLYPVIFTGAALRWVKLFEPFWYDELFTANIARTALAGLLPAIMGDVHPPLFYSLEWLIAHTIGSTEAILRLPSFLFGLLAIYLTYRLTRLITRQQKSALLAAWIIALLPAMIYYSAEARQYSLLLCEMLGCAIAILERRPRLFLAVAALLPITHNLGFVFLPLMALTALMIHRRRWIVMVLLSGLPGLLWLPFMIVQSRDIADGFWIVLPPGLGSVLETVTDNTISQRFGPEFALHAYTAAIVLTIVSMVFVARNWLLSKRGLVWFSMTIAPPLAIAAVSYIWRPVWLPRAFLASGVGFVIVWAYALINIKIPELKTLRSIAATGIIVALVGFETTSYREDVQAYLQACNGADSIFATTLPAMFTAAYYAPDETQFLWTGANDENQTLPESAKAALGFQEADLGDLSGDVCIVSYQTPMSHTDELAYIHLQLSGRPYTDYSAQINQIFKLIIYRVQI